MTQNITNVTKISDPSGGMVRSSRRRVTLKQMEEFAVEFFVRHGKGITYTDIVKAGLAGSKTNAQMLLKRRKRDGTLFTLADTKPQVYFPTCRKAKVIESRKSIVPVRPTEEGVLGTSPLAEALDLGKTRNFLQVMLAARSLPLQMHRIQMHTWLKDPAAYTDVVSDDWAKGTFPKRHLEHIGRRDVNFRLSKNCRIMIDVSCTAAPFPIQCEADISRFFLFIGQAYDRLLLWLGDPRERLVPDPKSWILKGCDLNKDVEINAAEQLTLPDIQLWRAEGVFMTYVKVLNQEKAVYRIEEKLALDVGLENFLDSILYPERRIEGTEIGKDDHVM